MSSHRRSLLLECSQTWRPEGPNTPRTVHSCCCPTTFISFLHFLLKAKLCCFYCHSFFSESWATGRMHSGLPCIRIRSCCTQSSLINQYAGRTYPAWCFFAVHHRHCYFGSADSNHRQSIRHTPGLSDHCVHTPKYTSSTVFMTASCTSVCLFVQKPQPLATLHDVVASVCGLVACG